MFTLYDTAHNKLCAIGNYSDFYVENTIGGSSSPIIPDTLHFKYPLEDGAPIDYECYIATDTDEYIVKEKNLQTADSGITWVEYVCDLNIEPLKGTLLDSFAPGSVTAEDAANLALAGTGWAVGYCDVTKKRTAAKKQCTVYDAVSEIAADYNCEITFDTIGKLVNIHVRQGADRGVYFAEQLNLKQLQQQGNSRDYVTRLYPIGKDGLTISAVNDGTIYVSNYQYSTKIIAAYWIDNRYASAQDLYDDAVERLEYLSKPTRSYSAAIVDLANVSDEWGLLDFTLGDFITLLSESTGVREQQRIIKIDRYPDEPERSTVELANRIASLDDIILKVSDAAITVENATDTTGAVQGSSVSVTNSDGTVSTLNAAVANIGTLVATKVDTTYLEANYITATDISSTYVDTDYLTANYITADSVKSTYATIDNLNATDAKITNLKVSTAMINDASITAAKIASATISTANIATGAITTALIGTGAVATAQIADGSITDAKIVTLTANKISAGTIDASKITVTNLSCANLTVGTINGTQIASGAITSTNLASAVNTSISNAQATATAAQTSLSNMQIGGRNLWITATATNNYITSAGSLYAADMQNMTSDYIAIDPAKPYEYSYWGTITSGNSLWTGWAFYDANKAFVGSRQVKTESVVSADTHLHYSYAVTVPADIQSTSKYIRIGSRLLQNGGSAKFELGNMATDWTPTPEDVQLQICTAQTTANGKNAIYRQANQPSGGTYTAGDVWFDTGNGNRAYVYSGSAWTLSQFGYQAISSIDAGAITTGSLAAARIAAGTITGTQIASATIAAGNIATGTITATQIASGTITATQISTATITGDRLVANTITASQIASGTITATQIAANTITAAKIAASTITTTEIAANTITAGDIAAGTITATQIAAGTITGDKIAAGTITATNIDVTNLSVYKVQAQSDSTAYLTMTSAGMSLYRGAALSLTITADSGSNYASIIPKGTYNGLWLGTDTASNTSANGLWVTASGCFFYSGSWGQISLGYGNWVTFTTSGGTTYYLGGGSGQRWTTVPIVDANGVMEVGQYIDFHESSGDTADYSSRLYSSGGVLNTMNDLYVRGRITANTTNYPQIVGNGTILQLNLDSTTSANGIVIAGGTVRPPGDANVNLGASGHRWATIYAASGTINTSDRNEKNTIEQLDADKAAAFIAALNPVSFKYNDGTSGRTHYGMISQDVEDAMTALGMSSLDFAGFIKSPKINEEIGTDADGNPTLTETPIPGEYIYGLRYEEFIAPLIKTVQGLLTRCAALEAKIQELQSTA